MAKGPTLRQVQDARRRRLQKLVAQAREFGPATYHPARRLTWSYAEGCAPRLTWSAWLDLQQASNGEACLVPRVFVQMNTGVKGAVTLGGFDAFDRLRAILAEVSR